MPCITFGITPSPYWRAAHEWAWAHSKYFALWRFIPPALSIAGQLVFGLRPRKDAIEMILITIGSYVVLAVAEYVWNLLFRAPNAIHRELTATITELGGQALVVSEDPQGTRPGDNATQAKGLKFEVSIDPVVVRAEGHAERLAMIVVRCTYEGAEPPPSPAFFSLVVYMHVPMTSPTPFLLEVGRPGASSRVAGSGFSTKVPSTEVWFKVVHIDGIRPRETRVFQIMGLRCDATFPAFQNSDAVRVRIDATGGPVRCNTEIVAHVERGIEFEVMAPHPGVNLVGQATDSPISPVATLRFREGFPYAFKTGYPGQLVERSDGRFVLTGEGSPFSASMAHATRLMVRFYRIPQGVRLFVAEFASRRAKPNMFGAMLVEDSSNLRPADGQVKIDGSVGIRELLPVNGTAEAVWEVSSESRSLGALAIDLTLCVSYEPGSARTTRDIGSIEVGGGFAPVIPPSQHATAWMSADPNQPIPRFSQNTLVSSTVPLRHLKEWAAPDSSRP